MGITKAERIFEQTYQSCKKHIDTWGYETNPDGTACGFSCLLCEKNETVSIRTVNVIAKVLSTKRRILQSDVDLKIVSNEEAAKEAEILNMVETTLNNNRLNLESFRAELKRLKNNH